MGMIACFVSVDELTQKKLINNPELINDFLYPEDDDESENYMDVDKAWQAIHFLLNNDPWDGKEPLSLVVLGGKEIGEDLGYGAARFLLPLQVKEIHQALSKISESDLRKNYVPKIMEEEDIYPSVMWVREGEAAFEYVFQYYKELFEFYSSAALRGNGIITWIN